MRLRPLPICIVILAACGGDGGGVTPPESGQPSRAQVDAMSTALTALLEYAYEQPPILFSVRAGGGAPAIRADLAPYHGGINCPEGGRTGAVGTFAETAAHEYINVADTLVECGMRDGAGAIWHFTSTAALRSSIDLKTLDSLSYGKTQTDVGSVQYTRGAESGTCAIDISIADTATSATAVTRAATLRIHTRGFICNRSVHSDTVIRYPWPDEG